ncbi:MAG: hypothetical protein U1F49_07290 [Rubrivivax sp.]
MSGIAVPGVDAVARLRTGPGGVPLAPVGAAAAGREADGVPWLHLFAFTVALAVLVPRSLLALRGVAVVAGVATLPLAIDGQPPRSCCSAAAARRPRQAVQVLARLLSFAMRRRWRCVRCWRRSSVRRSNCTPRLRSRTATKTSPCRRRRPAQLAHRLVRPRRDARTRRKVIRRRWSSRRFAAAAAGVAGR